MTSGSCRSITIAAGGSTDERMPCSRTRRANSRGSNCSISTTGTPEREREQHLVDAGPERERHRHEVRHRRAPFAAAATPAQRSDHAVEQPEDRVVPQRHRLGPAGRARRELDDRLAAVEPPRLRRGQRDAQSLRRTTSSTAAMPVVSIARSRSAAGTRGLSGTNAPPAFHTANHAAIVRGRVRRRAHRSRTRRAPRRAARW